MKLDKKGFTLIELLAVVVILLAISVIAISSISAAIERNKAKQNRMRLDLIVSNVDTYYQTHKNSFNRNCNTIDDLINKGVITEDEARDGDGEMFSGVVEYKNNTFQYNAEITSCK